MAWLLAFGLLIPFSASAAEAPISSSPATLPSGIVKIIPTRTPQACVPYVIVGDYLYVPSSARELHIYDLVTLEIVGSVELEQPAGRLRLDGNELRDLHNAESPQTLLTFNAPVSEPANPYDTYLIGSRLAQADDETRRQLPGVQYIWKDALFGSPDLGSLVCFGNGRISHLTYDDDLGGRSYRMFLRGERPLGVTTLATVIELNDRLLPVRQIYKPADDMDIVVAVASDGKTLAVIRTDQIRSADGTQPHALDIMTYGSNKLLASMLVGSGYANSDRTQYLAPFAGGYLLANKNLAWLHPDGRQWSVRARPVAGKSADKDPTITLSHHRIIMSDREGVIYIVDPSVVLGRKVPPPSYEGGPMPNVPLVPSSRETSPSRDPLGLTQH